MGIKDTHTPLFGFAAIAAAVAVTHGLRGIVRARPWGLTALVAFGTAISAMAQGQTQLDSRVAAVASAPAVKAMTVQAGPLVDGEFALDGSLQAVRQATVSAQTGGNVLALSVKAGDRVRTGQVIARLDGREAQTVVERSQAVLAQAQAEARNARLHAERTLELRRRGFMSQAALDVAETQSRAAEAGVAQAEAARAQARLASTYAQVLAPFDGVVLATHLDAGDLASPGRPVATVYAPGALRAVVQVPASRAATARIARNVAVTLPDGRSLAPTRRTEMSATDPVSQTVEWRLDLPAAALQNLMPGQTVRVRFEGSPEQAHTAKSPLPAAIVVPEAAVLRRGELTAVYVTRDDGFALRAVRLGPRRAGGGVEVLAGLKPGDRVALDALRAGLAGATVAP
jgi:RND family efflux transporter MFP subunit